MYLGTGSGKTFIAVMLIRHMRDLVMRGKKVVFLCNNVALLEQQAKVIASTTGLETNSYCGSQGKFNISDRNSLFILSLIVILNYKRLCPLVPLSSDKCEICLSDKYSQPMQGH